MRMRKSSTLRSLVLCSENKSCLSLNPHLNIPLLSAGSCILSYTPKETIRILGVRLGLFLLLCGTVLLSCLLLPAFRFISSKRTEAERRGRKPPVSEALGLSNLELSREAAKLNLYVESYPTLGPYSPERASPVKVEMDDDIHSLDSLSNESMTSSEDETGVPSQ